MIASVGRPASASPVRKCANTLDMGQALPDELVTRQTLSRAAAARAIEGTYILASRRGIRRRGRASIARRSQPLWRDSIRTDRPPNHSVISLQPFHRRRLAIGSPRARSTTSVGGISEGRTETKLHPYPRKQILPFKEYPCHPKSTK
jgi:hypothetical protein